MNLREELHAAGMTYDGRLGELPGHVTNGSLDAQVKVVHAYLDEFVKFLKGELLTAGDFGIFKDHEYIKDEYLETVPYPGYVAIETIKKARDKWLAT